MEAFSLLKYWRGGGAAPAPAPAPAPGLLSSSSTTVLTALPPTQNATESDNDDDDGPFFDLEFTVADDFDDPHDNPEPNHSSSSSSSSSSDHDSQEEEEEEDEDNIIEGEREFKFTLSPSANDRGESLSPSDDLFFKGKLVQLDPSSFEVEPNSKPPQFTASLFKSATKFRVFMSALKKSKSNTTTTATTDSVATNPKHPDTQQQIPESQKKQQQQQQPVPDRKLFTVKFKVEEVPIMSLFTRDNSSKGNNNKSKQNPEDSPSSSSKEVIMHKYLKMVKPLYVRRVSRRYGDKLGFSGHLNLNPEAKPAPPPAMAEKKQADGGPENAGTNGKTQKQGNLPAGLRVVCKHLGKSRSASSTLAAAPPSALLSSKRRDDSLLQQQDGIQGAILHCKRSFNASRECQSSQLPRSVSDPLHEIPSQLSRKSSKDKRL